MKGALNYSCCLLSHGKRVVNHRASVAINNSVENRSNDRHLTVTAQETAETKTLQEDSGSWPCQALATPLVARFRHHFCRPDSVARLLRRLGLGQS